MSRHRLPLTILGPTASGKTALAILLAQCLNGRIINADSLQVYADCPTLTARPDAGEMLAADHRLYGFLPASEKMDVARWLGLAKQEAARAQAAGQVPIFCGGTGFYLKALEEGLSPIPPIPDAVAAEAEARLGTLGIASFEAEVLRTDPGLAGQFAAGDRQRLLRAWAVHRETGQGLSHWQRAPRVGGLGRMQGFALMPDRAALYERIDQRFTTMMSGGALQEVRAVAKDVEDPVQLPIAQAIGFKELLAVLEGTLETAEAATQASRLTRNYAKRQMTWVRNQALSAILLSYNTVNAQEIEYLCDLIISFISQNR